MCYNTSPYTPYYIYLRGTIYVLSRTPCSPYIGFRVSRLALGLWVFGIWSSVQRLRIAQKGPTSGKRNCCRLQISTCGHKAHTRPLDTQRQSLSSFWHNNHWKAVPLRIQPSKPRRLMLIPTNAYLWYFAGQEPPKFALKPEPAIGNCKPYTGKPRAQVFNSRG